MYTTTITNIEIHDGDTFPYFLAEVRIGDDFTASEGPYWSANIKVFIDKDDSLSLSEIKKRAIAAAYDYLSKIAADHPH